MRKKLIFTIIFVVFVIGGVSASRFAILGGKEPQTPQQNTVTDTIKEEVNTEASDSPIESGDPDFNIEDIYSVGTINYFDNDTWAVAELVPDDPDIYQRGWAILKKENNTYNIVVGPGTSFPADTLSGVPQEVVDYMDKQGLTGE